MEASNLRALFRNAASLVQRLRNFSSSSSAADSPRKWTFFSDAPEEGGSSVYRHALKFQRPATIKWKKGLCNSVSFIGTVDGPIKQFYRGEDQFGACTALRVRTSLNSKGFFRVNLKMWDQMAHISIKHLKQNDFIYVSGHLGLYTIVDEEGKPTTKYQVIVKEINFVMQSGKETPFKHSKQPDSGGSGENAIRKYKQRLHLWQVFFSNPSEWWDRRNAKVKPNHPDFKHKDTGEALWIGHNDPPWIKRQLELYDSSFAAPSKRQDASYSSSLSQWF